MNSLHIDTDEKRLVILQQTFMRALERRGLRLEFIYSTKRDNAGLLHVSAEGLRFKAPLWIISPNGGYNERYAYARETAVISSISREKSLNYLSI